MNRWKLLGLTIVFLWFMIGGITHFTQPEFFVAIMPPYIGYHLAIVYGSGVLEIVGAIGILITRWREWAGNGLLLLTIFVTPANVHMWLHPELFPDVPPAMLSVRLIVQALLLLCIWTSTRTESSLTN